MVKTLTSSGSLDATAKNWLGNQACSIDQLYADVFLRPVISFCAFGFIAYALRAIVEIAGVGK